MLCDNSIKKVLSLDFTGNTETVFEVFVFRSANAKFVNDFAPLWVTLLLSCSKYPRDKSFLLTIVSYIKKDKLNKYIREKKSPRSLSELPSNWPGWFSPIHFNFYLLFKYETIVNRNGLSLGYSERDTSSVELVSRLVYLRPLIHCDSITESLTFGLRWACSTTAIT